MRDRQEEFLKLYERTYNSMTKLNSSLQDRYMKQPQVQETAGMISISEYITAYDGIGIRKATYTYSKMILLSILAGIFIGLGGLFSTVCSMSIENYSLSKLISGVAFSSGLIMIIQTQSELFTGNCWLISPFARGKITLFELFRNLFTTYIGNAIGTMLIALMVFSSKIYLMDDGLFKAVSVQIAQNKVSLDFGSLMIRGILCNILVCTAVLLAGRSRSTSGVVLGSMIPVSLFVACGFEHSIANMYYIPLASLLDNSITSRMMWHNLLPVTLGNIVGGFAFVLLMTLVHGVKKKR